MNPQGQLLFCDYADNTISLPTQGKGIFRSRWLHAKGKHAGNSVGLVSDRENSPLSGAWNAVLHRLRLILIVNSVGNSEASRLGQAFVQLLRTRIKAAHDAL